MIGLYTDRHPKPYSLAAGMGSTLIGLVVLSRAPSFPVILLGAFIVLPYGQRSIAWFAAIALTGVLILTEVGGWYGREVRAPAARREPPAHGLGPRRVGIALGLLAVLVFSKFVYLASLTNYYTFYLIHRFDLPVRSAQLLLFLFLGAAALGTFAGGPIGDRIGRKQVIWASILGVLPFTLMLPGADLTWTAILSVVIGLVLSSAFSTILVFAQELAPGRVGAVAGLFFGLSFGTAGLAAAGLGLLADHFGIETVYRAASVLPAQGLVTALLPDLNARRT